MPDLTRLLAAGALLATFGVLALPAQAEAQEIKRYDNPYIFDGVIREAPFELPFTIDQVRSEFDTNGRPKLNLYTRRKAADIEAEWKATFKAGREFAPHWVVVGHIFLVRKGNTAFTVQDTRGNGQHVILVMPDEATGGAILQVDARVRGNRNAAFRRVWMDFSPAGLEPYSIHLKAL